MCSAEPTSPLLYQKKATSTGSAFPTITSWVCMKQHQIQFIVIYQWNVCRGFWLWRHLIKFVSLLLFVLPGTKSIKTSFSPVKLACFKNSVTSWVDFSGGQHHTLCMDGEGTLGPLEGTGATSPTCTESDVTKTGVIILTSPSAVRNAPQERLQLWRN